MTTTATELRELPDDELRQKLAEGKEELFNLRFQIVTGQLDDPRRIKQVKREIARVLTVMREREIALTSDAETTR
ncbi:50S ribosomal protein L29 [Nitriliruptor alkaliphilus]|uniref:50S ribosomal protein L29 n=1 Tax=Nitriliruptor alkaliphilus TaxID=427918 RepID=UPI000A760B7F|nr:50S ribosomal protein L29 [Nitriliruptor alkaliphilus]